MATKALIVAVFAAAVLCLGVDGSELSVNSTTTVTDSKGQPVVIANMTMVASGYNHTSDSAMLNGFVQNQFNKLQKNPEQFAESDTFGLRRPPPPHPSGGLVLSYTLEVHTQFNIGPSPVRTLKFYMRTEIYARKKKNHEVLFALRAPTF